MKYIVGLGNPTEEYVDTRHNVGRNILEIFRKENKFPEWQDVGKLNSLISEGKLGKEKVTLIMPQTFMNDSGGPLKKIITSKKKAEDLLVIYDELDLGIGALKMSFNKSSGGHKGLDSIIRKIGTKEFSRLRVGISPVTPAGKFKKVKGEEKVKKHVLTKFKPAEEKVVKKTFKNASKAVGLFVEAGRVKATGEVNSWR